MPLCAPQRRLWIANGIFMCQLITRHYNFLVKSLLLLAVLSVLAGVNQFYIWSQVHQYYGLDLPTHTNVWNDVLQADEDVARKRLENPLFIMSSKMLVAKNKQSLDASKTAHNGAEKLWYYFEFKLKDQLQYAHYPRVLLMAPVVMVSRWTGVDANFIFSLLAVGLVFLSWYLLQLVPKLHGKTLAPAVSIGILLGFNVLSLTMNGRMLWALVAISLVITIHARACQQRSVLVSTILCFLALWFSAVSTGTFIVVFAALAVLCLLFRAFTKQSWLNSLPYVAILALWSPYLMISMSKNLAYYGGGIAGMINMLNHGAGGILITYLPVMCIAAVIGLWLLVQLTRKLPMMAYPLLIFVLGVGASLFGYGVLVTTIPSIAMISGLQISDWLSKRHERTAISSRVLKGTC